MIAQTSNRGDDAGWVAALWVGLGAVAFAPFAGVFAQVSAGIHRPENAALALALVGALGLGLVAAPSLAAWRALRVGLRRGPTIGRRLGPHLVATLALAAWLVPAALPPLCVAAAAAVLRRPVEEKV